MSMIERVVGERDIHKVDLHIHTYYSDGQASPSSIVKKAAVMGYSVIAITDHDGTGGVKEALTEGKEEGLVVIPGIELATELEAGIGPVSYTHLDVYKRQCFGCMWRRRQQQG